MAPASRPGSPSSLLATSDEALYRDIAARLGANAAASEALPFPAETVEALTIPGLDDLEKRIREARHLVAEWNARLYDACCTTKPDQAVLRKAISGVVGDVGDAAVSALADAIGGATHLPDAICKDVAAIVVHGAFDASRSVSCEVWGRTVASTGGTQLR